MAYGEPIRAGNAAALDALSRVAHTATIRFVIVVRLKTWAEHEEAKGGAGPASKTKSGGRARGSEGSCSPGGEGWRHRGPKVDVRQDTTGTSGALPQPEGVAGTLAASQRREEASFLCQVHWLQHAEALKPHEAGHGQDRDAASQVVRQFTHSVVTYSFGCHHLYFEEECTEYEFD